MREDEEKNRIEALAERMDAANAAFEVGCKSPSREYNRLFGAPALRDILNLRQVAVTTRG